ncbi:GntR family transcriptional regulator [Calidithermus chliarophilus]|uniref:GntR family transcriptional regulator n=1 Tax=Calidithermus chliarophilus TaxID=52023 RepID=UPI00041D4C16|nr:GntR family transcriptional regulator [Calidithermus chliarophilus]
MNLPEALLHLNPQAPIPLYLQLKEAMLQVLHSGAWPEGKPLPSERELSEGLSISRATVRQAIHELELEGWLERKQGRGTFPRPAKVEQPLARVTGFSENMRLAGIEPSTRLLSARLEPAPAHLLKAMRLRPGAVVAVVTRLRLADGEPLMLERAHLNYALTPGLLEHDLSGSLYDLLTHTYRLRFARGEETIQAVKAEPWLAKALGIPRGAVVLFTQRTVTTDTGAVLEHTERYGRADRCSFRVSLEGDNTQITLRESS